MASSVVDRSEVRALARIVNDYKAADARMLEVLYGYRPTYMTCETLRQKATAVFSSEVSWSGKLQKKFKGLLDEEISLRYWATHIFRLTSARDSKQFSARIQGHRHYFNLLQDIRVLFGSKYPKHSEAAKNARNPTVMQNRYEVLRSTMISDYQLELTEEVHELLSQTEPDQFVRADLDSRALSELDDLSVITDLLTSLTLDFSKFKERLVRATLSDDQGKVDVMQVAIGTRSPRRLEYC
jgi:hypothetical protein